TLASYTIMSVQPANLGAYSCRVSNPCGQTTSNAASLSLGSAPAISQQPVGAVSQPPGGPLSLSVAATGGGLSYQWRRNANTLANGGSISGATTATLTINPLSAADDGRYDVVVSNGCGGITSN